jgi:hypothetical protein
MDHDWPMSLPTHSWSFLTCYSLIQCHFRHILHEFLDLQLNFYDIQSKGCRWLQSWFPSINFFNIFHKMVLPHYSHCNKPLLKSSTPVAFLMSPLES